MQEGRGRWSDYLKSSGLRRPPARPEQPPRVAARPLELVAFLLSTAFTSYMFDTEFYNTKTRKTKGAHTLLAGALYKYNA